MAAQRGSNRQWTGCLSVLLLEGSDYVRVFILRRSKPAIPTNPVPRRPRVPGSGTAKLVSALEISSAVALTAD
jgi:hypothetical protein